MQATVRNINDRIVGDRPAPDVRLTFGHDSRAPQLARLALSILLGGADDRFAGSVEFARGVVLASSEMVANAVTHTTNGCCLEAWNTDPFRVEVSDSDLRPPILNLAPDENGGRGLQILNSLATMWGTRFESNGKTVWADFVRSQI